MEKLNLPSEAAMSFGLSKTEFVQMLLIFNPECSNERIKQVYRDVCLAFENGMLDDVLNDLRGYENFNQMVSLAKEQMTNEEESEENTREEAGN
jgi:hypothetical protein